MNDMISYAQHQEFLEREKVNARREYGCLVAEQQGFLDASTYEAPRLQYDDQRMTERYEVGFACGKAKLLQEGTNERQH